MRVAEIQRNTPLTSHSICVNKSALALVCNYVGFSLVYDKELHLSIELPLFLVKLYCKCCYRHIYLILIGVTSVYLMDCGIHGGVRLEFISCNVTSTPNNQVEWPEMKFEKIVA